MSKKAIPNGDLDFAAMAQAFANTIKKDSGRFEIAPGDAEQLDVAVGQYKAALQASRFGARHDGVMRGRRVWKEYAWR